MWQHNKVCCAGLVQCQLQLARTASDVCNIQCQRVWGHIVQRVYQQVCKRNLQGAAHKRHQWSYGRLALSFASGKTASLDMSGRLQRWQYSAIVQMSSN
jgi:hypothetical protein